MYAGRVACCRMAIHGEYTTGRTDRRTDATVTSRFPQDAASVKKRSRHRGISTMSQLNWFMISNELRAGRAAGSGSVLSSGGAVVALVPVSIAAQQSSAAAADTAGTGPGTSSLFPMLIRSILSTQFARSIRGADSSRASIGRT